MRSLIVNQPRSMNLTKDNWIQEVLHKELIPTANINHDYNFNDIEVNLKNHDLSKKMKMVSLFLVIK